MNHPRMPSPAILVAVLALVAALAGTAVAGPDASTSAITKKKVKKIATKQIHKLAPGLSVAHADTADNANNLGGQPPNAFLQDSGVRFAEVNADGTLGETKGISGANVTHPDEGAYCITGLDPAPTGVQVTLRFGNTINTSYFAEITPTPPTPPSSCGGLQVGIATRNPMGNPTAVPFNVVVF
jgi:uncharacterized cupredoxin-like copper-binding protein